MGRFDDEILALGKREGGKGEEKLGAPTNRCGVYTYEPVRGYTNKPVCGFLTKMDFR